MANELDKSKSMSHEEVEKEKFPFVKEVTQRFQHWTGVSSPDIEDAISDLTGDTYYEMRKLTSILLSHVEDLIRRGKYKGYLDGSELNSEQREEVEKVREDLKEEVRSQINLAWKAVLNKQKVGVDKLAIALKTSLKTYEEDTKTDSN